MNKVKIVVTDYVESDMAWEAEQFAHLNADLYTFQMAAAHPAELLTVAAGADILIVNAAVIDEVVINGLKACKLILRHGVGYDNVDVEAAGRKGILVGNIPDFCTTEVAEHTLMLILASLRQLDAQRWMFNRAMIDGKWDYNQVGPVSCLSGKTVGIIGFGRIGSSLFRMLQGFGVDFRVCDPYISEERCRKFGVRRVPLDDLLRESDVVTVHTPASEETYHLIDVPQLNRMKDTAVLINTARGSIVNIEALCQALDQGWIGAAGVDVYEGQEPPKTSLGLLACDKVICTPHAAWMSQEAAWKIRVDILENVRMFLEGRGIKHPVNRVYAIV